MRAQLRRRFYKPAAIIDGYDEAREAAQEVYTGAGNAEAYKPAAITENLQEQAESITEAIYAGQALNSKYNSQVKEE